MDQAEPDSPIVLDLAGDGFLLSGPIPPVEFDIDGDGDAERLAWIAAGSNEAFLALDRNANGLIDNGTELFGNHTEQPRGWQGRNGFNALSVFDACQNGGNEDGRISNLDAIYPELLLWLDRNRDGISQPQELRSLEQEGVASITVEPSLSRARDEHGNLLKYWGDFQFTHGATEWAVDVFFVYAP